MCTIIIFLIIYFAQPVAEYHTDVNQYHDQAERPDGEKAAPAGANAVSAIPTGKGMFVWKMVQKKVKKNLKKTPFFSQ